MASPEPSMENDSFDVVFVCTGNRARSPLAEALYSHHATGLPTRATSFGLLDLGPSPPLGKAVTVGRKLGIDLTPHRSRALDHVTLAGVDLVLGFELSHVSTAIVDANAPPDKSFLLAEFVALAETIGLGADPVSQARLQVKATDSRRTRGHPDPSAVIADPLGKPDSYMARIAEHIDELVRQLVAALFGVAPGGAAAHGLSGPAPSGRG